MDAGHGRWPHAGINLVRDPVGLHHLRAVVETAGLALHDEKPKRISCLFDETIAGCSFGRGRGWACGKCRQRAASSRRPSRPSADALSWAISYSTVTYPERSEFNAIGALRTMACRAIPYLLAGRGAFKLKTFPQIGRDFLSRLSILPCRSTAKTTASD